MNWQSITGFNFTYAIDGGAWLRDASGYTNWESYQTIVSKVGKDWWNRQIAKQGMFTGCWIDVA